jgi:hypothetical protein
LRANPTIQYSQNIRRNLIASVALALFLLAIFAFGQEPVGSAARWRRLGCSSVWIVGLGVLCIQSGLRGNACNAHRLI